MLTIKPFILSLVAITSLNGCATLFNGKAQYVPVVVPDETIIHDDQGTEYSIVRRVPHRDTISYIKLERKKEYILEFLYQGENVKVAVPREMEGAWIGLDLLFAPSIFVDLATGSWYNFSGLRVRFNHDTTASLQKEGPSYETFQPSRQEDPRLGCSLAIGIGRDFPSSVFPFIPTGIFGFIGYEFTPQLTGLLTIREYGCDINLDAHSVYSDVLTNIYSYHLEGRYRFLDELYISAGGGLTNFYANELQIRDTTVPNSSFSQSVGTVSASIGYLSNSWFCELKHTLATSAIVFPNGELGRLQSTSIIFGLIAHF